MSRAVGAAQVKFYKRDPDRALAGMSELTLKQRGAYSSLIDLLYSRDGDVPDDDRRVARMLSCHWREWKAVKKQLMDLGKIWVEGGRLNAKRVQETLKEAADFSQVQSKRASERWQKSENNKENNVTPMRGGNALTPTPTPTPTKKERKRKPAAEPPDFLDFWNSVPRKVGRFEAVIAYCKAIESGVDPPKINAAAKRWRAAEEKTEEKYIPHPATWLNNRRYEDYHVQPERETNLEFDPETKEWRWKSGFEPKNPERTN